MEGAWLQQQHVDVIDVSHIFKHCCRHPSVPPCHSPGLPSLWHWLLKACSGNPQQFLQHQTHTISEPVCIPAGFLHSNGSILPSRSLYPYPATWHTQAPLHSIKGVVRLLLSSQRRPLTAHRRLSASHLLLLVHSSHHKALQARPVGQLRRHHRHPLHHTKESDKFLAIIELDRGTFQMRTSRRWASKQGLRVVHQV